MQRKITSIEIQKNNTDRFSVFLDDEFAFGLHKDVLLESGIAKGDYLDDAQITEIKAREEIKRTKLKALKLLSVRARSKKELDERLKKTGFSQAAVSATLDDLQRLDLINDLKFAVMFARSKMIQKPQGKLALSLELKKKGIEEPDIKTAIDAAYENTSESEVALSLAVKKKRQCKNVTKVRARKRVSDYLLRRGFQFEVVHDIMDRWEYLETENEG